MVVMTQKGADLGISPMSCQVPVEFRQPPVPGSARALTGFHRQMFGLVSGGVRNLTESESHDVPPSPQYF